MSRDDSAVLVGCLGGGQLARMLAIAGHALGVRLRCWDPDPDACAQEVSEHLCAPWDDDQACDAFLEGVDVVTYEFENVPTTLCERIASRRALRPGVRSLQVCQDRAHEKKLFEAAGLMVAPWKRAENEVQLGVAIAAAHVPAIMKTNRGGYDGKGQRRIEREDLVVDAWEGLGRVPVLVESFVPFDRELSLIGARTLTGACAFYPLVENAHEGGILRSSIAPAPGVDDRMRDEAIVQTQALLEVLDHVGVFTVEFFEHGGRLLANECAPRVHNSGHWTIEGARTSQFEQHLRCILGLPLGTSDLLGHSAMVNIIGSMPEPADRARLDARIHHYGKAPRPGRKLGHVSTVRETPEERDASLDALTRVIVPA